MKRKFIMMSMLNQDPRQPGNDIDVYLRPFVEEPLQLWREKDVPLQDENEQRNLTYERCCL
jgi:hypothetical protein